jgi:hypothetical protein
MYWVRGGYFAETGGGLVAFEDADEFDDAGVVMEEVG